MILQERDDYLICAPFFPQSRPPYASFYPQRYDADLGTGSILIISVAKPFTLQRFAWDGSDETVGGVETKYTYTDASTRKVKETTGGVSVTTNETIPIGYLPGEVILAARAMTGYNDEQGLPVVWMDLNTAGRTWQSKTTPFSGVQAYGISNTLVPGDGLFSGVASFEGVEYDTDGYFDPIHPTRLTFPFDGWYKVEAYGQWDAVGTTLQEGFTMMFLETDDSTAVPFFMEDEKYSPSPNSHTSSLFSTHRIIGNNGPLSAGQWKGLAFKQNSGRDRYVVNAWLALTYLGKITP